MDEQKKKGVIKPRIIFYGKSDTKEWAQTLRLIDTFDNALRSLCGLFEIEIHRDEGIYYETPLDEAAGRRSPFVVFRLAISVHEIQFLPASIKFLEGFCGMVESGCGLSCSFEWPVE